ncbi:MAG: hypothetical protein MZV65_48020 [Chromatiales bacterium]|nr:hypothetical protein [Chromatiales bacterium]
MEIAVLSKRWRPAIQRGRLRLLDLRLRCAAAVVSDGAGGHGGGDVASKLVVSTILQDFSRDRGACRPPPSLESLRPRQPHDHRAPARRAPAQGHARHGHGAS